MNVLYFYIFILVHPYIALWWKSFPQAGHKSWEAFVPVYNYYVAFKIGSKKPWWALLLLFPGVHLVMWSVANVSYIRRFGYYSLVDTLQGVFFPYVIMTKISQSENDILPETNWANSKELGEREWGDHLALFLTLPVIGHVLALGIAAVTRHKPGEKTKVKEWGDSLMFALVAASIIRTYVFEPFQIPTGSMEKTLLVGDFLFVNKLAYGPKVPVTPLSYPLVHNTVPWVNIRSYAGLETSDYTRMPGFSDVTRNDVVVFNYPSGDTAVYDPRMPNGLMGHDYHGILLDEALYFWKKIDKNEAYIESLTKLISDSIRNASPLDQYNLVNLNQFAREQASKRIEMTKGDDFITNMEYWKDVARKSIASGVTFSRGGMSPQIQDRIEHYGLIYRPVDKRENYIKRCVGVAGDFVEIKNSVLYINDKIANEPKETQNLQYFVDSIDIPSKDVMVQKYGLERNRGGVERGDYFPMQSSGYVMNLTRSQKKKLVKDFPYATFELNLTPYASKDSTGRFTTGQMIENLGTFPKDVNINNNITNFQRFQIPFAGQTIELNEINIPWFRRIITAYEGHSLSEKDDGIYIDGKKVTQYTFAMNYYWLMGDNRYNSADSRIWGFVPEDHVVGKASMVWFSKDPYQGIRWERLFSFIK